MGDDREQQVQGTRERWSNRRILFLAAIIVLIVYAVFRLPTALTQVFGRAHETLILLILSVALTYFLLPIVRLLCRVPVELDPKIKRSIAAILSIVIFLAVLGLLATLTVSPIVVEIGQVVEIVSEWAEEDFAQRVEGYLESVLENLPEEIRERVEARIDVDEEGWTVDRVTEILLEQIERWGEAILAWHLQFVVTVISSVRYVVGFVIIVVLTYYFLTDAGSIRNGMEAHVPPDARPRYHQTLDDMDAVIQAYVHTLLVVSVIIGIATIIILYFAGVEAYLTFGILAGIANMVPVLGAIVAVTAMVAISLLQVGFQRSLIILAIYTGVELVVDRIVAPKLMSEGARLHPVAVIIALLVGAELFGFIGLFIAVPVLAAARIAWIHYRAHMSGGDVAEEFDELIGSSKSSDSEDEVKDVRPDEEPKSIVADSESEDAEDTGRADDVEDGAE